uniref:EOG090X019S n=1 Tax=Daphnia dolichocephala TaxID=2282166 RepID=A0A4Y7M4J2_9CRUS|nr:EOG090X019S [Daphnia dolichocephala]
MSSPKKPLRKKLSSRTSHEDDGVFQTTAELHGTIGASRSTNFSFKKDFVKDSMVVLGPERTFKLRNPLVLSSSSGLQQQSSGLLHAMDDVISNKQEKLVEFVYRGSFRIAEGDWFEPKLADVKGAAFSAKARDFEAKLDDVFKNSSVRDIYHHSEILTFEGYPVFIINWIWPIIRNEDYDISVFFNLYCTTKKTANDAVEMESVLREELAGKFPVNVHIDPSSVEVKARTVKISSNESSDLVDRRTDVDSASEGNYGRSLENDLSNSIPPHPTSPPSHGGDSAVNSGVKKGQQSRPLLTSSTMRPSLTSSGPIVPISPFSRPQDHRERSGCVPISLSFCRHLAYNSTSFPNLLGARVAQEVDRLNEAAKLLVESECSSYIQHVLCYILQPPCDPDASTADGFVPPNPLPLMPFARIPKNLPPCRSLCMAAVTSCEARLGLSLQVSRRQDVVGNKLQNNDAANGLRDLLRCELFPIDDGLDSCTTKPSMNYVMEADPSECVRFMTANGQTSRICDGLMDCHDFSDEVACNYCPEGQVHCGVGASCIDVNKRCDGVPDCPNGSDERGCLTVAPDMAAANFVHQYFHEGYIVFTEGNNTGKICVDSLNSSSLMSTARQQSFLEIFGESACRSMSYRIMERIEIRVDNERSADYAHLTEPIRWRATFLRAPCRKRQVLYLSCSGLECGNRPVHMHPDRPGTDLTLLPSAHGDWPWFAALIRDGVHACDATLVADQWLLTASSCFDGQSRAHWVARFAAVRLTSDAPWEQERRIIGMVKSPMKGNQLVLIKMESSVIYSDFVRPVCLARDHEAWISGSTSRCLFLGWGKDRDNLHEVTAKVVQNPKCDNVTTLCADVLTTFDTCRNDEFTGSPLLCQLNDGGSWSLVGISNENRHCDRSIDGQPLDRVYLGVSSISDWVMQTVRR